MTDFVDARLERPQKAVNYLRDVMMGTRSPGRDLNEVAIKAQNQLRDKMERPVDYENEYAQAYEAAMNFGPQALATKGIKPVGGIMDNPNFKKWFGGSKVVNEAGEPLTVYHGTNTPIKEFSDHNFGRTDSGWFGSGHYFTPDTETASMYATHWGNKPEGSNIIPSYLNLKNPLILSDEKGIGNMTTPEFIKRYGNPKNKEEAIALTNVLKDYGYDGVIRIGGVPATTEYLVFSPNQIKSATGNQGTFDPLDPDITKALLPVALAGQYARDRNNDGR